MELSFRLKTIAQMITPCPVVADVGCDHGYLAIRLVKTGTAGRVIAMDVAKGPLSRAKANIKRAGYGDRIETRLSDGVARLAPGEANAVVMAGIGGSLMMRLMQKDRQILDTVSELILSPQSEIEQVRIFLAGHSYIIREEQMITDGGKDYVIFRTGHGHMRYEKRCEYKYGRCLLEKRNPVLQKSMERERQMLLNLKQSLEGVDTRGARQRMKEIADDLQCVEEGLRYYDM